MAPLDFVYLAPPDGAAPGSALEAVMTYAAIRSRPAGVAANARVRFTYESGAGWAADEVDLGACVEAARAVRELLVSARPLDARDLALPEAASERRVETAEMRQRADGLVTALRSAALNLERLAVGSAPETIDLDALRHALERLSWIGMPQALPRLAAGLSPEDRDGLLEQAAAAMEDAARTLAALDAAEASIGRATASADAQCDLDVKRIQIVLGADFRVLPRFQADDAARTGAAFAGSATLQGFTPLAAVEWVQQMAHVREGVARLATCLSYAEALAAAARMRFVVGQQPFDAKDRWVALPRDPQRPEGGARISMVAHDTGFDVSGALSGFMVDEWVETIPSAKETVGVAFHYDAPNSQPPHAVLLAVPPDERPRWDMAAIEAVILETLDLAKLRSVDPAALADDPDYGNLLPALYVAVNPAGDTISTDLSRAAAL
jgi:hypothetical protein